jgi:hypothetical protein
MKKISELWLNVVPIRPEHASFMKGCTHNCAHVQEMLNKGTPLIIYPQLFTVTEGKTMEVALCPDCYLRTRGPNN